ncbi:MAG: hypothetical protein AB7C96_04195 [Hydrogenovibrio sp.]
MSKIEGKHVLEIPLEEYQNTAWPELYYWLQVVPTEEFPEFEALYRLITKHHKTLEEYPTFPKTDFIENIDQSGHQTNLKFNSFLISYPSFPAAINFVKQVIHNPEFSNYKTFNETLLIRFLAVQAELRQQYFHDPSSKNFSNTLIQSSRVLRLHFTHALRDFETRAQKVLKESGLSKNDLLASKSLSNNDKTLRLLQKLYTTLDSSSVSNVNILSFFERVEKFLGTYDFQPLVRLFHYYIDDKELSQRVMSSRRRKNFKASKSATQRRDPDSKSVTPEHIEHEFTPKELEVDGTTRKISEVIDSGESPDEFTNIPKVFSESLRIEPLEEVNPKEIDANLSETSRLSPAKGLSGKAQFRKAKDASQHILKRNLMLMESWDALSNAEVQHLISALHNLLFGGEELQQKTIQVLKSTIGDNHRIADAEFFYAGTALFISLIAGCAIEELYFAHHLDDITNKALSSRRVFCLENRLLYFESSTPQYKTKLDGSISQAFHKNQSLCSIVLPCSLCHKLTELTQDKHVSSKLRRIFDEDTVQFAKNTLLAINRIHSTRLTITRIANYLLFLANQIYADKALSGLFGFSKSEPASQNYYANHSIVEINQLYQALLDKLPWHLSQEALNALLQFEESDDIDRIGSRNLATDKMVEDTVLRLNDCHTQLMDKSFIEQHNFLVAYTYFLILFFTGSRPARNLMVSQYKFDTINQILFVSDKDNSDYFSTRPVPLHPILYRQLKYLDTHLKFYEPIHWPTAEHEYAYFLNAKNQPETFEVQKAFEILGFDNKLPKNFLRAWFRKLLLESKYFGQNADALLSHWDAGEEFFSRNSGFDFWQARGAFDKAWERYFQNHTRPLILELANA